MDSPLSNHHPCTIKKDGETFNSSEQLYFARKAEICGTTEARGAIMGCSNPKTQKSMGEAIVSTDDWEKVKFDVMTDACRLKFGQNPPLQEFLLDKADTVLCEDSPSDGVWGLAMSRNNPNSVKAALATMEDTCTKNRMGKILMFLRKEFCDIAAMEIK
jgi:ribA/ribD-fused uncharacterized protein